MLACLQANTDNTTKAAAEMGNKQRQTLCMQCFKPASDVSPHAMQTTEPKS
jgi:hypothetical protein